MTYAMNRRDFLKHAVAYVAGTYVPLIGSVEPVTALHKKGHETKIEDILQLSKNVGHLAQSTYYTLFEAFKKTPEVITVGEVGNYVAIGFEVKKPSKVMNVYSSTYNKNMYPEPLSLTHAPTFNPEIKLYISTPNNESGTQTIESADILISFLVDKQLMYKVTDKRAGIDAYLDSLSDEQRKHYLSLLETHLKEFLSELEKAVNKAEARRPKL